MQLHEIVLATNNANKKKEIRRLLQNDIFKIWGAFDFYKKDIPETGTTYEENAVIKATALFSMCRKASLGDDSGLEVDALNGEPGLYSARYAATPEAKIKKLLKAMEGQKNRKAKQICTLAFCHSQLKEPVIFRGEIHGTIAKEPMGTGGFGYDSVFYIPKRRKTLAELSEDEKNKISHRGLAVSMFLEWLSAF